MSQNRRYSEIRDLNVFRGRIDQNIAWFNTPVNDSPGVNTARVSARLEEIFRKDFISIFLFFQKAFQRGAFKIFQDESKTVFRMDDIHDLDNAPHIETFNPLILFPETCHSVEVGWMVLSRLMMSDCDSLTLCPR